MEGPQEICSSSQKANCKPTRNHVVPPVSHRAKSEPRMPPPQHPGNSKQVVPSGRMNQVVPPWRTEKRPSAVLTPARGISPKAGSPPPSPIIKVKEEFEPDWGGEEPATPGTPAGTPAETSQRIQPEAPSQTQSGSQPLPAPGSPPPLFPDDVDDDMIGVRMHWNIVIGSQKQVWPSKMSETALSHKGSDGGTSSCPCA